MHKKPVLIAVAAAFAASICAHAADVPGNFAFAQANEGYRSVVGALSRGFRSSRESFVTWVDEGNLVVAQEPDFASRVLVVGGAGRTVKAAYPSGDGRSVFFLQEEEGAPSTRQLLRLDVERVGQQEVVASAPGLPSRFVSAPDGQALAFTEGTMLYEYRRSSSGKWERRPLLDPQDPRSAAAVGLEDPVYSPDGRRIAFVSERKGRQSYIVVRDLVAGETRYIEPSVFNDRSPTWSPDGSELAFARVPSNLTMQYRFSPELERVPWSILSADLKSGAVRTVWTADTGLGSVPQDTSLIWAPSDEIVFRWEKTGWNLLYAVSAHRGSVRLLTPGEGEVSDISLSGDGRILFYEANIGDLMHPHIWSVALSGGRPGQLTKGAGVERRPRVSAGGYLSYISDNREDGPPRVIIRNPDGKPHALPTHEGAKASHDQALWKQFLPTRVVSTRAVDGLTSHHVVVQPRRPPPSKGYPVIVNAHGGPDMQTLPGTSWAYLFGQYAADNGFLYVDMNYRGSSGFGASYRLPEGRGATGGSEYEDLAGLADYLKKRGDVDPGRIGIMGSSYGGHIVGLAMSRLPESFAAGVSLFGVADWVVEMKKDQEEEGWASAPPSYIRLSERTRIEELAYQSSPTPRLDRWRGPTLFTIGDLDKKGHVESVTDLAYRLMERRVPVEIYVDPAGGHNVFPQERVLAFFRKHL